MQPLSPDRYRHLREGAQVIEADSHGEKVLRLADGNYIKLFRRKRLISSALFWPYAQRFADNARRLEQLGVPCPRIIAVYRMAALQRDLVYYKPLPGLTLRQLRDGQGEAPSDLLEQLARFIAELHQAGVYFRSLHLGNVVLTPQGKLGLIDIADLSIQRWPLLGSQRLRNFRHMLRDARDLAWLRSDGDSRFANTYRAASGRQFRLPGLE
jgi:tRNA A-37 threonylcarbamoyl transferase component Bud32